MAKKSLPWEVSRGTLEPAQRKWYLNRDLEDKEVLQEWSGERAQQVQVPEMRERKYNLFQEWRGFVNGWNHIVERRKEGSEKDGGKKGRQEKVKQAGKIWTLCSEGFYLEIRREEVLIPSLAFSCPSPQALATGRVPFGFSSMPGDGNRGHSRVVSGCYNPPHLDSSLQFSRLLEPQCNLHLQKTESQSQRDLFGTIELERKPAFLALGWSSPCCTTTSFLLKYVFLGRTFASTRGECCEGTKSPTWHFPRASCCVPCSPRALYKPLVPLMALGQADGICSYLKYLFWESSVAVLHVFWQNQAGHGLGLWWCLTLWGDAWAVEETQKWVLFTLKRPYQPWN